MLKNETSIVVKEAINNIVIIGTFDQYMIWCQIRIPLLPGYLTDLSAFALNNDSPQLTNTLICLEI